ncbi:hypothetical protein LXL04_014564 [Taraxacum kok-saghyz]
MNIFRLIADMTHLASVIDLLVKIHSMQSCAEHRTSNLKDNVSAKAHIGWCSGFIDRIIYDTPQSSDSK